MTYPESHEKNESEQDSTTHYSYSFPSRVISSNDDSEIEVSCSLIFSSIIFSSTLLWRSHGA